MLGFGCEDAALLQRAGGYAGAGVGGVSCQRDGAGGTWAAREGPRCQAKGSGPDPTGKAETTNNLEHRNVLEI